MKHPLDSPTSDRASKRLTPASPSKSDGNASPPKRPSGTLLSFFPQLQKSDKPTASTSSNATVEQGPVPTYKKEFWQKTANDVKKAVPGMRSSAIKDGIEASRQQVRTRSERSPAWAAEWNSSLFIRTCGFYKLTFSSDAASERIIQMSLVILACPAVPVSPAFSFLLEIVSEVFAMLASQHSVDRAFIDCIFIVNAFSPSQVAAYLFPRVSADVLAFMMSIHRDGLLDTAAWSSLPRVAMKTLESIVYGHMGVPVSLDGLNEFLGQGMGVYVGSAFSETLLSDLKGGAARAFGTGSGHLVSLCTISLLGCLVTHFLQNQRNRLQTVVKTSGKIGVKTQHHYSYLYGKPVINGKGQVIPIVQRHPPAYGSGPNDYMVILFSFGLDFKLLRPLGYIAEMVAAVALRAFDSRYAARLVELTEYSAVKTSWNGLNKQLPTVDNETRSNFLDPVSQSERGQTSVARILERAEASGSAPKWGYAKITPSSAWLRDNNKIVKTVKSLGDHTFAITFSSGNVLFSFGKFKGGRSAAYAISAHPSGWGKGFPKRTRSANQQHRRGH